MVGGDSYTTMWMYLRPLNCDYTWWKYINFVLYILPQFKKYIIALNIKKTWKCKKVFLSVKQ